MSEGPQQIGNVIDVKLPLFLKSERAVLHTSEYPFEILGFQDVEGLSEADQVLRLQ